MIYKALASQFKAYKVTQGELRVIKCLLKGYSNSQIAEHLGLQIGTVKFYLSSIYKKVGVRSRSEFLTKFQAAELDYDLQIEIRALQAELMNCRTLDQVKVAATKIGMGKHDIEELLAALK